MKKKSAKKSKKSIKKTKTAVKKVKLPGKLIGKVTHYFSDIKVGVIKLSGSLSQGDKIRIMGGENTDFNQQVKSIQVEHKEIKRAKKGDSIGLKVSEKVRDGYKVYRVK